MYGIVGQIQPAINCVMLAVKIDKTRDESFVYCILFIAKINWCDYVRYCRTQKCVLILKV